MPARLVGGDFFVQHANRGFIAADLDGIGAIPCLLYTSNTLATQAVQEIKHSLDHGRKTGGRLLMFGVGVIVIGVMPVSYTHLDVYKRQHIFCY